NVYTGKWVHVAVVIDRAANQLRLYLDGELAGAVSKEIPQFNMDKKLVIGNDNNRALRKIFSGRMKNCAIYSDVRSAETIKNDMQNLSLDNAIAAWSFDSVKESYDDLSGNGYTAGPNGKWLATKEEITDFDYSMVVVGDTQIVTYLYPNELHTIYDWIIDKKESKKIAYVMGLGDITDRNTDKEWKLAYEQISRLNGVLPYSLVRGNHDFIDGFEKTFNTAPYNTSYQGSYDHTPLNTCRRINVGKRKYLIFVLDIGPSDEVLNWADKIIANHPDHNVIITTHVYLGADGKHIPDGATKYKGINDPDDMWEKLIKKHHNISMVICGHAPSEKVVVNERVGDKGNVVTEMLIDHQDVDNSLRGVGVVVTLHFKNGSDKVIVETYSTIRGKYYLPENQFEMTVNTIEAGTYSEAGLDQALTIPNPPPPSDESQDTTSSEVIIEDEDVSSEQTIVSSEPIDSDKTSSKEQSTSSEPTSSEPETSSEASSEVSSENASSVVNSDAQPPSKDKGNNAALIIILCSLVVVLPSGAFGVYLLVKKGVFIKK
ncbi:MAG: metallophosphoesterase, partial [Oscillospiraceae bacterium]|nr:metallophosphoesterase [Oscillospiraceae bacterium]